MLEIDIPHREEYHRVNYEHQGKDAKMIYGRYDWKNRIVDSVAHYTNRFITVWKEGYCYHKIAFHSFNCVTLDQKDFGKYSIGADDI